MMVEAVSLGLAQRGHAVSRSLSLIQLGVSAPAGREAIRAPSIQNRRDWYGVKMRTGPPSRAFLSLALGVPRTSPFAEQI